MHSTRYTVKRGPHEFRVLAPLLNTDIPGMCKDNAEGHRVTEKEQSKGKTERDRRLSVDFPQRSNEDIVVNNLDPRIGGCKLTRKSTRQVPEFSESHRCAQGTQITWSADSQDTRLYPHVRHGHGSVRFLWKLHQVGLHKRGGHTHPTSTSKGSYSATLKIFIVNARGLYAQCH